MAIAIDETTIRTSTPPIKASVEYDYWREGNSMKYNLYIKAHCTTNGAWDNQRWGVNVYFNNSHIRDYRIYDNATLKPGTSGTIGKKEYVLAITGLSADINSGSIPISVQIFRTYNWADRNGFYNVYSPASSNTFTYLSGSLAVSSPSAPSAPSAVYIPGSTPPDRTINISWSASSGGSNGVSGYQTAYSRNGGSSWDYLDKYSTSYDLNLNDAGFVNGSILRAAVRSYSVVNGVRYYSPWSFSGNTTTLFVAPSAPLNLGLTYNTEEPIPTATYTASWSAPSSGGSNGVSGYTFRWLKTGANYSNEYDVNSLSEAITLVEGNYNVGDTISFKVRAYTVGQGARYYSGYSTSGTITIVSDKYIFLSLNGGAFEKRKIYISIDGAEFKEIKKNKFKII